VNNNCLDLGMNKSGFVHTLPGGRLIFIASFEYAAYEMNYINLMGPRAHIIHKVYKLISKGRRKQDNTMIITNCKQN
jgi:hypothetical protein